MVNPFTVIKEEQTLLISSKEVSVTFNGIGILLFSRIFRIIISEMK